MHALWFCNLVEFIQTDDSRLSTPNIIIGGDQQPMHGLIYIFADIAYSMLAQAQGHIG